MNDTSTNGTISVNIYAHYLKPSFFFVGIVTNLLLVWMIRNHLKRCPYRYSSHCSTILPAIIFSDLFLCVFGFLDSIAIFFDLGLYVLKFRCSIGTFIQFYTGFLVAWYLTILTSGIKNFSTPVLVYQCKLVGLISGIGILGFLAYFHCIWMMGVENNRCMAFAEWEKLLEMWRKIDFFFADLLPYNLVFIFGLKVAYNTFRQWWSEKSLDEPSNRSQFNGNEVKISTFVHKFRNEFFDLNSCLCESTKNCWFAAHHIKWILPITCSIVQLPMSLFIFSHNIFKLSNPEQNMTIRNFLALLVTAGHSLKILILFLSSHPFRKDFQLFISDLFSKNSIDYFSNNKPNTNIYASSILPISHSTNLGREQTESSKL